jgi:hypothetical protein
MSIRQSKKQTLQLLDGGRPALAPIRPTTLHVVWVNVGDAAPEFKDWYFSLRPSLAVKQLASIIAPLSAMQALGEEKIETEQVEKPDLAGLSPEEAEAAQQEYDEAVKKASSLHAVASFLTRMNETVQDLSAGLASILLEWNFVNEATGEALPNPNHNTEVIAALDVKLITAIASLVIGYLTGTAPNASKPTSTTSAPTEA